MCNEANLNLSHSLEQKIVINEHSKLPVLSLPFAHTILTNSLIFLQKMW